MCPKTFSRERRLFKAREFKRAFSCGQRSSDKLLTVLAVPNDLDGPRLGLAVARKHLRSAVSRNKVKRVVRESFRRRQDSLGRLDIVVLTRGGVAGATPAMINESLDRHWQRLETQQGPQGGD